MKQVTSEGTSEHQSRSQKSALISPTCRVRRRGSKAPDPPPQPVHIRTGRILVNMRRLSSLLTLFHKQQNLVLMTDLVQRFAVNEQFLFPDKLQGISIENHVFFRRYPACSCSFSPEIANKFAEKRLDKKQTEQKQVSTTYDTRHLTRRGSGKTAEPREGWQLDLGTWIPFPIRWEQGPLGRRNVPENGRLANLSGTLRDKSGPCETHLVVPCCSLINIAGPGPQPDVDSQSNTTCPRIWASTPVSAECPCNAFQFRLDPQAQRHTLPPSLLLVFNGCTQDPVWHCPPPPPPHTHTAT